MASETVLDKNEIINSDINLLKEKFTKTFSNFIENCHPLHINEKNMYFYTKNGQVFGYDIDKNDMYEPTYASKYKIIDEYIKSFYDILLVESFQSTANKKLDAMVPLEVRYAYKEKYCGRRFFYDKSRNCIYVWDLMTRKWETSDEVNKLRYMFSNSEIIEEENKNVKVVTNKSLSDFNVEYEDLVEIPVRLNDMSIHYFYPKKKTVYSCYRGNSWKTYNDDDSLKNIVRLISEKSDFFVKHPIFALTD